MVDAACRMITRLLQIKDGMHQSFSTARRVNLTTVLFERLSRLYNVYKVAPEIDSAWSLKWPQNGEF